MGKNTVKARQRKKGFGEEEAERERVDERFEKKVHESGNTP